MQLNIAERIGLLMVFPQKGSYVNLKVAQGIALVVGLAADENKNISGNWDGDQFTYDQKKDYETEYDFSDGELTYVRDLLRKLDDTGNLQSYMISLYEKFMKGD